MGKGQRRKRQARQSEKPKTSQRLDLLPHIRRLEWVCALGLTALIVFLHLYRVRYAGALWRDEVGTVYVATLPSFSQMWSSLIYESFPMVPYCLVRIWAAIPAFRSDVGLRVLGALVGLGILSVLWLNKRLIGNHVPILTLVLFGLNPIVFQWGDTIRGYGPAALSILAAYGLVWKVVESPTPKWIALATLAAIAGVQCMYQNSLLLFAICLGGVLVCLRQRNWRKMLVVLGIGAMAALSLLPYFRIITAARAIFIVAQLSFGFQRTLDMFELALSSGSQFLLFTWFLCGGLSIIVGGYLLLRSRFVVSEGRVDLAIYGLTVFVVSTGSFLLFLEATKLETHPWYYIVLMGSIAVSVDTQIELATTTAAAKICRLVFGLAVAAAVIPILWREATTIRQTNIDIVASELGQRAAQGDFVVVNPWFYGITFQRYYRGQAAWITPPPLEDLGLTRYDLLKEKIAMENPIQPVFDGMQKSLSSGHRVWWVGDIAAPPQGQLPPSLPPAPHGPNGWYSGSYLGAWTYQLGYFVQSHALEAEGVQLPNSQPVNPYEHLIVQSFKGWRP